MGALSAWDLAGWGNLPHKAISLLKTMFPVLNIKWSLGPDNLTRFDVRS